MSATNYPERPTGEGPSGFRTEYNSEGPSSSKSDAATSAGDTRDGPSSSKIDAATAAGDTSERPSSTKSDAAATAVAATGGIGKAS